MGTLIRLSGAVTAIRPETGRVGRCSPSPIPVIASRLIQHAVWEVVLAVMFARRALRIHRDEYEDQARLRRELMNVVRGGLSR
jgi:primosomal protein N''